MRADNCSRLDLQTDGGAGKCYRGVTLFTVVGCWGGRDDQDWCYVGTAYPSTCTCLTLGSCRKETANCMR